MNRLPPRSKLTLLTATAVLLLGALLYGCVQDKTSTVSGRVVDVAGKPIGDILIAAIPDQDIRQHLFKQRDNKSEPKNRELENQWQTDETDESGQFFITDIISGPISIGIVRQFQMQEVQNLEPDYRIISTKIGKRTFYPTITFAIEPGEHIENVQITVRSLMRIRGQIVFADESPLANAMVYYTRQQRDLDGEGNSDVGCIQTDAAGYFMQSVEILGSTRLRWNFKGFQQRRSGLASKLDNRAMIWSSS